MNHASLALWSTLTNKPSSSLKPALTELAEAQARAPTLDPNASFDGKSLLELASEWGDNLVRPDDAKRWLEPLPEDQVGLCLLERGGNPWRPLTSAEISGSKRAGDPPGEFSAQGGVAPFLAAVDHGAWPLVSAFLHHPARPAWEDLFARCHWDQQLPLLGMLFRKRPEALQVLIACGMDPNFRHPVTGDPILFMATTATVAAALVEQGADPKARDMAGLTLLGRYDKDRHGAGQSTDRAAWAKVMGHDNVDERQVWVDACTGSLSKVRPLFSRPAQMKTWQWEPHDGGAPLTLYDAAGHGRISHPTNARDSLYNHLIKGLESTPAAPDITWLAYRGHDEGVGPEATAERIVRAVTAWVALDQRLANLDFIPSSTQPHVGNEEKFNVWVEKALTPDQRDAVLDQWLRWHATQPARWNWPGSLVDHFGAPRVSTQGWSARHRVILLAHQMQWHLNNAVTAMNVASNTASGNVQAALATRHQEKSKEAQCALVDTLMALLRARREAGDDVSSETWDQIHRSLVRTNKDSLRSDIEQRWTAWEREEQATAQAPQHNPRRSRCRS